MYLVEITGYFKYTLRFSAINDKESVPERSGKEGVGVVIPRTYHR